MSGGEVFLKNLRMAAFACALITGYCAGNLKLEVCLISASRILSHYPHVLHRIICALLALAFTILASRADTLVQFRTTLGDIEVELYDQDKPATVQNFIRYIQSGRYMNGFSHRLIPNFVLQGGGFVVTNRGTTNWNIAAAATYPPVTNDIPHGQILQQCFWHHRHGKNQRSQLGDLTIFF